MKALINVKAVRTFACLLVVSVLTTIASPLHLVFAAPTSQKKAPQNGVLNQLGRFFNDFGREKTNSPFDKKYQNSVLRLMRDFIFSASVLPKLTTAGCTFKTVAEYATNPKCFPESTPDAKKKLTLATIQKNLFHEVYMGTTGKCGSHRDGRKGTYTIEQCIGYPWGVEKCTVMSEAIYTIGVIPSHCVTKSVSSAPTKLRNVIERAFDGLKNPSSGHTSNKATPAEVRAHLVKVLNSNRTYKGACKATTLELLSTLPACSTSSLTNPDNYMSMKEVWRTLYTSAFDASSGDYGISRQNSVGRKGTLFELGVVPNYTGEDPKKLIDGTKFFGITLPKIKEKTPAENTKLSIGLMNSVLICLSGGFSLISCTVKLPDEYIRGFLQIFTNEDVISDKSNWKLKYGDVSFGELGIDLVANTLLVYALQGSTNSLITLLNSKFWKKSPKDLAKILIDQKTTMKIALVGPFIVVGLTACKLLNQCDPKAFQFQNDSLLNDAKKAAIIAVPVAIVFCWGLFKSNPKCVPNMVAQIHFEFTAGHFLFKQDGGVVLKPGEYHTATRLGIGAFTAYGGVVFFEKMFATLAKLLTKLNDGVVEFLEKRKPSTLVTLLTKLNKLPNFANFLNTLGKQVGKRWQWVVSGLFAVSQLTSLQNDLRAYDRFTENPNCINSPSCSFDTLKTAVTISNHPIPKTWNYVVTIINDIRISKVAVISGNTLTIPADTDLKLVGSLFSKIESDKNAICKTYRNRTNLDATFKAYLYTACKSASII